MSKKIRILPQTFGLTANFSAFSPASAIYYIDVPNLARKQK